MRQDALAGLVAGAANVLAGHPFDTVKVLLQSETRGQERVGGLATARHLLRTAGARGLYRGVAAPLVGGSLETAVNYTVYHGVRSALLDAELSAGRAGTASSLGLPASALLAGGVAGVALTVVLSPLELLKCRVQAGADESVRAAARRVWAQAGLRGFARGLGPTLAREVPGNALFFASYEGASCIPSSVPSRPHSVHPLAALQRSSASAGFQDSSLSAPLCGGLAGVAYWLVVLPLDTAKTRIQVLSPGQPCAELGLLGTLREQYQQRGLAEGWYAGVRPVVARAFVANAAQWAAFEWALASLK